VTVVESAFPDDGEERTRRIPARVPAQVDGLTSLRSVARSMVHCGVHAVLVTGDAGPVGLVTGRDVVEAVAAGADPDLVWAGEIMRPTPRMVSSGQHPTDIAEEMVAYDLEVVAVFDDNASMGVASVLDVLGAVIRAQRDAKQARC
jgi:CBS domain-containing protein